MAINHQGHKMTVEEYFQLDSDPSAKYEYIEGYAVVMSGGSVGHARIAKNIVREFDSRLQAGPCQVHIFDVKVLVPAIASYFLPDVTVSCDADDNELDTQAISSPCLIIEVLSPSEVSNPPVVTRIYPGQFALSVCRDFPPPAGRNVVISSISARSIHHVRKHKHWTYVCGDL